MRKKRKIIEWHGNIFVIGILVFTVLATSLITMKGLRDNRKSYAFEELQSISKVQVDLLNVEIKDQYVPLNVLADYVSTNNREFGKGDMVTIAEALRSVHRLCTIGLADKNGNVIDYQGNAMGNISDRDYFQEIINGRSETFVSYLETTKVLNEPRVLFSVPVYRDQEIVGVLFASKEIAILEKALFLDEFFDKTASSFIVDTEGNIIAANEKTYEDISKNRLLNNYKSESAENITLQEKIEDILNQENYKQYTREGKYLVHSKIGINDWVLFNIVDEQSVMLQYQDGEKVLLKLIFSIDIIIFLSVAVISVFFYLNRKKALIEVESFRNQHECYKSLLYEMNCSVLEYSVPDEKIKYDEGITELLNVEGEVNLTDIVIALKEKHPEFDIKELRNQFQKAVGERKAATFESTVIKEGNDIQWIKVILLPIQNLKGEVTDVFAAVLNTTEYHEEFEASSRFIEVVPGGMHRCYLSQPIHLEFVNDGLCKMLGYTVEEFYDLVGNKYSLAIVEEDRKIFRDFVYELAKKESTKTCEYRMICKDGSWLSVSDTMESKRNAAGIMYGYSVIIDLSEYKKKQEEMEMELSATKAQLLQARIANANSQMQPHFLYNALASIREIVLVDPEYASDLIFDFSTHLRACIRSMSNDNLVSFSQELENIKAYVNIEQMRFGKKLKVSYDITTEDFNIIPLGLQPIVENAIRHGVYERGRAGGTVYIKTYEEEKNWVIQIADDGVGFDVEDIWKQIKCGERDSTGLQNMVLRFEKQMKAKVDIRSEVGVGTKVAIYIPKGADDENNNC